MLKLQNGRADLASIKVCVVEDNDDFRGVLVNLLKSHGAGDVHEFPNGAEAWAVLKRERFDLVLSDIDMPEMNGLELLDCIQSLDQPVPVVMVSGHAMHEDARQRGALGYVQKPFLNEALWDEIAKALHAHAQSHQPVHVSPTKERPTFVTVADVESLIQGWGARPWAPVDLFFPLRFWFLALMALGFCVGLLFVPDLVANTLSDQPAEVARLSRFLYFRGWFLAIMLMLGFYAYSSSGFLGIFLGSCLLLGSVNFVFDLFNVYAEVLLRPTPRTIALMSMRLLALWCLYLSVKTVSRVPDVRNRFNVFLPLKKTPGNQVPY